MTLKKRRRSPRLSNLVCVKALVMSNAIIHRMSREEAAKWVADGDGAYISKSEWKKVKANAK